MKRKLQKLLRALRNPQKLRRYLAWLAAQTRPFWPSLLLMAAIDLASIVIGFGSSFVSKDVVDTATAGAPFARAFIAMILLTLVPIAIGALVGLLRTLINERFAFGIRLGVFDRILSADYLALSRYHSGDLLTRMTSDADTIASGVASAIPSLAMIFARLLIAFVLLFGFSPFLALSALLLAPAGLLISLITGERLKSLSKEVKEHEAAYRSFMQEQTANITVVKTFCMEDASREQMGKYRERTLCSGATAWASSPTRSSAASFPSVICFPSATASSACITAASPTAR